MDVMVADGRKRKRQKRIENLVAAMCKRKVLERNLGLCIP